MPQPAEPAMPRRRVGAFEALLAAVVLAIIGFGIDVVIDRLPVFTLLFGAAGLALSAARVYAGYRRERRTGTGPR